MTRSTTRAIEVSRYNHFETGGMKIMLSCSDTGNVWKYQGEDYEAPTRGKDRARALEHGKI